VRSPRPRLAVLLGVTVLAVLGLAHSAEIRERAAEGLGRGMPPREAELARGFVLGEEEGIDPKTREDFRRSGLSHLLAVSGENVTLLALLAMPLLGALGVPLRERLVWVLALVVVYVPVAGAGPSVQRAGVMGAAGLLATLAGRRGSRLFALALAAAITVAIDPDVAADPGWQLSFAAVLGILLLAAPLRMAISSRLGAGSWRRALAEGLAVTVAATLATAPLIAERFETVSTTTLVANVVAMPAVAPAMWLGMLSAGLAQLPWLPPAALNALAALPLAYVAQVAAWCASPSWAEVHVRLSGAETLATYVLLGGLFAGAGRLARARRLAAARRLGAARQPLAPPKSRRSFRARPLALLVALLVFVYWMPWGGGGQGAVTALRIEVLDVGQGDAILLRPRGRPPVLVDGGPPGDGLAGDLSGAGVTDLAAAVVTHDQSDHAGGIEELLGSFPVERLLYARAGAPLLARARSAGAVPGRIWAGRELRDGPLRLEVLWPPRELLGAAAAGADPNVLALVMVARWRDFSMLLTADAEAESVPIDPGPVDVLKVAHHGSEDAGLAGLLDEARPRLAVISVGAENPYGHPTAATLRTLASHHVPTLRTDLDGTIALDVSRAGVEVSTNG